uniref:Uncharacterized protein n=1 Tax=Romanomermis culicivorax TaxID=13658 RepID=A0A915K4C3_ROMCU
MAPTTGDEQNCKKLNIDPKNPANMQIFLSQSFQIPCFIFFTSKKNGIVSIILRGADEILERFQNCGQYML